MNKIFKIFLTPLLVSVAVTTVMAQAQPLTLDLQVLNADKMQTLFVSDLDLQQAGSAEELFVMTLTKNTAEAFPQVHLVLRITKDGQELVSALSNSFRIPASFIQKTVNNIDLFNNDFYLEPGNDSTLIRLREPSLSDEITDLQQEVLTTGKAPVGIYELIVDIYDDSPEGAGRVAHQVVPFLNATNPSYVRLVAPGAPVGRMAAPAIYTQFPVFQWNGNGDEYEVLVFERKSLQQSLDDIVNQAPNWHSQPLTDNYSVIYPQGGAGVLPLEFDKTYYWMVRMIIHTSSGDQHINSELWEFTLKNPAEGGNAQGELSKENVIKFLRDLLGERAAGLEQNLNGYHTTVIRVNGLEISIQELYRLINEYRNHSVKVLDVIMPTATE